MLKRWYSDSSLFLAFIHCIKHIINFTTLQGQVPPYCVDYNQILTTVKNSWIGACALVTNFVKKSLSFSGVLDRLRQFCILFFHCPNCLVHVINISEPVISLYNTGTH